MKVMIVTKKRLLLIALAAVLALSATFSALFTLRSKAVGRLLPIYSVSTDQKRVALTFDAAWGNSNTQAILSILKKHSVRATFFVTGEWAEKYPDDLKAIAADGHEIANHSDRHGHVAKLNKDEIKADAESCNGKIERIIGKRPAFYRGPYGEYTNSSIEAVSELGLLSIQWNVDSIDWREDATEKTVYERVMKKVGCGSIILFHTDRSVTESALELILVSLKREGYSAGTVGELIYKDGYTIDRCGKQIKNGAAK